MFSLFSFRSTLVWEEDHGLYSIRMRNYEVWRKEEGEGREKGWEKPFMYMHKRAYSVLGGKNIKEGKIFERYF